LGNEDETHLLWGLGEKRVVNAEKRFTLLAEGVQGPQHTVPLVVEGRRRPALKVRHYVNYNDTEGQAYIELSRLVNLVVV
jgi:CRISPR-associated protein (TIGR03984 family)